MNDEIDQDRRIDALFIVVLFIRRGMDGKGRIKTGDRSQREKCTQIDERIKKRRARDQRSDDEWRKYNAQNVWLQGLGFCINLERIIQGLVVSVMSEIDLEHIMPNVQHNSKVKHYKENKNM